MAETYLSQHAWPYLFVGVCIVGSQLLVVWISSSMSHSIFGEEKAQTQINHDFKLNNAFNEIGLPLPMFLQWHFVEQYSGIFHIQLYSSWLIYGRENVWTPIVKISVELEIKSDLFHFFKTLYGE